MWKNTVMLLCFMLCVMISELNNEIANSKVL